MRACNYAVLLDLENMAKLVSCTPMCIWRRSGEICFVSNEFYSLTGFNKNLLLDRTSFIFEYLDHKSVSNYFQIFNELLAFGYNDINKRKKLLMLNACSSTSSKITEGFSFTTDGKAIFTKCNLLLSNGLYLKCACCWTVKRDSFNIPILVMGQFLPIFEMDWSLFFGLITDYSFYMHSVRFFDFIAYFLLRLAIQYSLAFLFFILLSVSTIIFIFMYSFTL